MIYLDNNSTTPVDPLVLEAMLPYFTRAFGNPSNQSHALGMKAAQAIERAREQVADAIGAAGKEIVFTSGATESNNLALIGILRDYPGQHRHVVASAIEHKSVIEPLRHLQQSGWRVTYIAPDSNGRINVAHIAEAISSDTVLVSVMAANNEVGTLQPVTEIGRLCHDNDIVFHCDGAQALGRIPIDVESWQVDLLSLSAHKAYGPKGSGALYVHNRVRKLLGPLCFGGGQESGLRPGTLNVPSIVGFGVACQRATELLPADSQRFAILTDRLRLSLIEQCPDAIVHGRSPHQLPGLLSIAFPGVDGDAFFFALQGLAISQGSACTAGSPEPSHVLTAMGVDYELARSTFRFGIGRFTTIDEVDQVPALVMSAVHAVSI